MQVQRVQNNNYNTNFKGTIKNNKALQELKAGLAPIQLKKLGEYIDTVESVKDGKTFVYKLVPIAENKTMVPTISQEIAYDRFHDKLTTAPIFRDTDKKDPLNVFKQLADLYKYMKL
ncbi:hypothetical protein J6P92_04655 [bacterium]|nr:hypothetical protein [bacterium]